MLAAIDAMLDFEDALAIAQSNYDESELLAAAAWMSWADCIANQEPEPGPPGPPPEAT